MPPTEIIHPTMKSLGLDRLSVEARRRLADELWESVLPYDEPSSLTQAQMDDLDHREEAERRNPSPVFPWRRCFGVLAWQSDR